MEELGELRRVEALYGLIELLQKLRKRQLAIPRRMRCCKLIDSLLVRLGKCKRGKLALLLLAHAVQLKVVKQWGGDAKRDLAVTRGSVADTRVRSGALRLLE